MLRRMLASEEGILFLAHAVTGMNLLNDADYVMAFDADQLHALAN